MGLGFKENGINLPLKKPEKPQPLKDKDGRISDPDIAMFLAESEEMYKSSGLDSKSKMTQDILDITGRALQEEKVGEYEDKVLEDIADRLRKITRLFSEEELSILEKHWGKAGELIFNKTEYSD